MEIAMLETTILYFVDLQARIKKSGEKQKAARIVKQEEKRRSDFAASVVSAEFMNQGFCSLSVKIYAAAFFH